MRGLVTLATAFALPANFPQRDLIVLTAFTVVLVTLVVQGMTLVPLVRWLGLDGRDSRSREVETARGELAAAALEALDGRDGDGAEELRRLYGIKRQAADDPAVRRQLEQRRETGLAVLDSQRERLEVLRGDHRIGVEAYQLLQEELDWRELTLLPEGDRVIEES